jgi:hypothetical protein
MRSPSSLCFSFSPSLLTLSIYPSVSLHPLSLNLSIHPSAQPTSHPTPPFLATCREGGGVSLSFLCPDYTRTRLNSVPNILCASQELFRRHQLYESQVPRLQHTRKETCSYVSYFSASSAMSAKSPSPAIFLQRSWSVQLKKKKSEQGSVLRIIHCQRNQRVNIFDAFTEVCVVTRLLLLLADYS